MNEKISQRWPVKSENLNLGMNEEIGRRWPVVSEKVNELAELLGRERLTVANRHEIGGLVIDMACLTDAFTDRHVVEEVSRYLRYFHNTLRNTSERSLLGMVKFHREFSPEQVAALWRLNWLHMESALRLPPHQRFGMLMRAIDERLSGRAFRQLVGQFDGIAILN